MTVKQMEGIRTFLAFLFITALLSGVFVVFKMHRPHDAPVSPAPAPAHVQRDPNEGWNNGGIPSPASQAPVYAAPPVPQVPEQAVVVSWYAVAAMCQDKEGSNVNVLWVWHTPATSVEDAKAQMLASLQKQKPEGLNWVALAEKIE